MAASTRSLAEEKTAVGDSDERCESQSASYVHVRGMGGPVEGRQSSSHVEASGHVDRAEQVVRSDVFGSHVHSPGCLLQGVEVDQCRLFAFAAMRSR